MYNFSKENDKSKMLMKKASLWCALSWDIFLCNCDHYFWGHFNFLWSSNTEGERILPSCLKHFLGSTMCWGILQAFKVFTLNVKVLKSCSKLSFGNVLKDFSCIQTLTFPTLWKHFFDSMLARCVEGFCCRYSNFAGTCIRWKLHIFLFQGEGCKCAKRWSRDNNINLEHQFLCQRL